MSDINITVSGTKRLLTKGKFCDKNIVVTAEETDCVLQEKTATENGAVTPDEGYDGLSKVTVDLPVADIYMQGYTDGEADGKIGQYDAFWDAYQENGNRTSYDYAFAGKGWTDETFKPKYDIRPINSLHLFSATAITDLVKLLKDAEAKLDLSNDTSSGYLAQGGKPNLQTLPTLDLRSRANINYLLNDCPVLRSIEKIILKDDGTQKFNAFSFANLPTLTEIRFEGTIGSSLEIKLSPLLSASSVQSIIDHLKDLTGAASQTLTLHAEVGGKLTTSQKAAITAKNWELVY